MAVHFEQCGDIGRTRITGELTIYTAAASKSELLAGFEACTRLETDLSAVTEIDAAGLQLLLLLKREAGAAGKTLSLIAHSQAVLKLFDLTQLAAYFGDPLLIPASADRSSGDSACPT